MDRRYFSEYNDIVRYLSADQQQLYYEWKREEALKKEAKLDRQAKEAEEARLSIIVNCQDCGFSLLPGDLGPLCIYCDEIRAERNMSSAKNRSVLRRGLIAANATAAGVNLTLGILDGAWLSYVCFVVSTLVTAFIILKGRR